MLMQRLDGEESEIVTRVLKLGFLLAVADPEALFDKLIFLANGVDVFSSFFSCFLNFF